jgi:hypothetical protein
MARGGRAHPALLVAATTGIVIASLSVHVAMLQVLKVPYPDPSGIGRWRSAVPWTQAAGLVALAAVIVPAVRTRGLMIRWAVVAALFTAINGVLRNALMGAVVTAGYAAPLAGLVFQLVVFLILSAIAVAGVSATRNLAARIALAIGVGAVWLYVLLRGLGTVLAPVMAWGARHAQPEIYTEPYGANVLIPSYVSFAETVMACIILRYLGRFASSRWDPQGFWRFAAVVLLARGTLAMTLIWGPMIGPSPAAGLLSVSQFFLQDLVMVMLVHGLFRKAPDLFGWTARPGA